MNPRSLALLACVYIPTTTTATPTQTRWTWAALWPKVPTKPIIATTQTIATIATIKTKGRRQPTLRHGKNKLHAIFVAKKVISSLTAIHTFVHKPPTLRVRQANLRGEGAKRI